MKVIEALYRYECTSIDMVTANCFSFSLSMRYFDQAAVFLESCLEYGLVKRSEETSKYHVSFAGLPSPFIAFHSSPDRSSILGVCTLS